MADLAIWWLDKASIPLAFELGAADAGWPNYLTDALVEARLSEGGFVNPANLAFDFSIDRTAIPDRLADMHVGVFIRKTDMRNVLGWPGVVTDESFKPVVLTDIRY